MELEVLLEILEESVKKHGEKPLTNKWLLNIVKMALNQQNYSGPDIGDDPNW